MCSGFLTSWLVNFWEKLRENSLRSRTMGKQLNGSHWVGPSWQFNYRKLYTSWRIRSHRMNSEMFPEEPLHIKEQLFKYKTTCLSLSHPLVAWQGNMSRLTYLLRNVLFPSSPEARMLMNGIQQPSTIWNLLQKFVLSCTHF